MICMLTCLSIYVEWISSHSIFLLHLLPSRKSGVGVGRGFPAGSGAELHP